MYLPTPYRPMVHLNARGFLPAHIGVTDVPTHPASRVATGEPDPGESGGHPRSYLVVRRPGGNQVIDVDEGAELVIGRSSAATVQIDDPKVSREHARIVRRDGVLQLVDLGSRNGTRVNGQTARGESVPLSSGDTIALGQAEILVAETAGQRDRRDPAVVAGELPGVVVSDPAMAQVFERVRRVAQAETTVLLLGETGVGKEVVAEQIHRQSPRAAGPLVRLNCGSLPESILESELFGHERGAFTGADKRKPGYLEAADGGTLFLDEVGELGSSTQTRLLRVLEDRKFMRVGGREEISTDLRVVAATNRDLERDVRSGRFRQDLFFRLSAFIIRLPPLRERPSEIDLFAELFARQFARRMNRARFRLDPDAITALRAYDWPGNVRELRTAIEHGVVLADDGVVTAQHLPDTVRGDRRAPASSGGMRGQVAETERLAIEEAMQAEAGNQTRAARRLGISRRALLYKLDKHGLKS
jgi:two-component system, NtrC family, response regulator AtoC